MNSHQNTESVLNAFAAETTHDRATLEHYLAEYPDLRLELLELASEIRLVTDEAKFATNNIDDPGLKNAWSAFSSTGTARQRATNPFREFTGPKFAELCESIGLPRGFVVAIRDKRVQLESIPDRFIAVAAKIMGTSIEVLSGYLEGTPGVIGSAEFKANKKPMAVEQITFRKLIEDTELSDIQKETALGYLENDRPD